MNQYYTYILANRSDTTLYIGVTNDIERRVAEHRSGTIPGFTQKYKCHKLVYFESFSDVEQAIAREKQLKKWSRAKKDALIDTMNKRNDMAGPLCHPERSRGISYDLLRSLHALRLVEMTKGRRSLGYARDDKGGSR